MHILNTHDARMESARQHKLTHQQTPSHTDRDYELWLRLAFPSSASSLSSSEEGERRKEEEEASEGRARVSPTITEEGWKGVSSQENGKRSKGAWRMAVVPAPCILLRRHGANESTRRKGEQVCVVCVYIGGKEGGGDAYGGTDRERVVVLYTCAESE